jgi:hypothetical protein
VELFQSFFERIVGQCVEAGLVDGSKLFCDSSLVQANASCHSVVDTQGLKRYLNPAYRELEARLLEQEENKTEQEEKTNSGDDPPRRNVVNQRFLSTTDPEAWFVKGRAKPSFMIKRTGG